MKRYHTSLPCSLVWTKLDEAVNFGGLVNVAVRSGLPVSALSFGPELQASLVPAEAGLIWRLLLKRQLPDAAAGPGGLRASRRYFRKRGRRPRGARPDKRALTCATTEKRMYVPCSVYEG